MRRRQRLVISLVPAWLGAVAKTRSRTELAILVFGCCVDPLNELFGRAVATGNLVFVNAMCVLVWSSIFLYE